MGGFFDDVGDFFGDFFSDIAGPVATIASFIPGPWQPFAMAYKGIDALANNNPLGAALSFAGAGGWGDFGGWDGATDGYGIDFDGGWGGATNSYGMENFGNEFGLSDYGSYGGGDASNWFGSPDAFGVGDFSQYASGLSGLSMRGGIDYGSSDAVNQLGAFGEAGFNWGNAQSALKLGGAAMNIGSGLYGMSQADQLRKQAQQAGQRSDPWGNSGGRGLADQQLQELMRNPGQVMSRDPSYDLRMQGAQRAMAPLGQDSGAMAVAGANASTDWYNQRLQQLGSLTGAPGNPGGAQQTEMLGQQSANDLASRSIASMGYGVTRLGGGGQQADYDKFQEWMQTRGGR